MVMLPLLAQDERSKPQRLQRIVVGRAQGGSQFEPPSAIRPREKWDQWTMSVVALSVVGPPLQLLILRNLLEFEHHCRRDVRTGLSNSHELAVARYVSWDREAPGFSGEDRVVVTRERLQHSQRSPLDYTRRGLSWSSQDPFRSWFTSWDLGQAMELVMLPSPRQCRLYELYAARMWARP